MSDDDQDIWPWTLDPQVEPFTALDWAVIAAAVGLFVIVAIGAARWILGS